MEEQKIKRLLFELNEEEVPSSVDLWPALRIKTTAVVQKDGTSVQKRRQRTVQILAFALTAALILAVALLGLTPQGRALADTIIQFFTTADQLSFPVAPDRSTNGPIPTDSQTYLLELVPEKSSSTPLSTPDVSDPNCEGAALLSYPCQIERAEAKAGFDAREFPAGPQGVVFQSVEVNSVQKEIKITYDVIGGGGWIDFRQGIGEIHDGLWRKVPGDAVQAVLVGDLPGEYVQGIFTSDGSGEATWDPEAAVQRLRWQDGERWFSLEKNGDPFPIEYMDREEMIALAASLVDRPQQSKSQLRAEYLTSITDAEILSGIDLKEPTLLPKGFSFSHAEYDAQNHSVRLVYKLSGRPGDAGLVILETPLENVEQSEDGYYEGEDYQTLALQTDDLRITLSFFGSQWFGGRLDEAGLTAIAESMR